MKLKISKQSLIGIWLFSFICLLIGQILVSLRIAGIEPAEIVKPKQIIQNTAIPTSAYCIMAILITFLILFFLPKTRAIGFNIFFAFISFGILAVGFYGIIKVTLAKHLDDYSNGILISSIVLLSCISVAVLGAIINHIKAKMPVKQQIPPPLPRTNSEFLKDCGLLDNTTFANIALKIRKELACYNNNPVDKILADMTIADAAIHPEDSLDIVDFSILLEKHLEVKIEEKEIIHLIEMNQNGLKVSEFINELLKLKITKTVD